MTTVSRSRFRNRFENPELWTRKDCLIVHSKHEKRVLERKEEREKALSAVPRGPFLSLPQHTVNPESGPGCRPSLILGLGLGLGLTAGTRARIAIDLVSHITSNV